MQDVVEEKLLGVSAFDSEGVTELLSPPYGVYNTAKWRCLETKGLRMATTTRTRRRRRSTAQRYLANLRTESPGHSYVVLLGLRTFDTAGLLERVKEGLSYHTWERLRLNTELPSDALRALVQISPRTLNRRKEEGRFHPDESDRLLRATRVFASALSLFEGDANAARRWLTTAQPALGGATPVDYAATEVGAREVEDLMGRLEYGIAS